MRPQKMTPLEIGLALRAYVEGTSVADIASALHRNRDAIWRHIRRRKLSRPQGPRPCKSHSNSPQICSESLKGEIDSLAATATIVPKPEPEIMAVRNIESILAERGQTHGDFTDNARIMQALKGVIHESLNWGTLSDVQREALEMIMHKVGRICSGNPNINDHWDDIAGYAKLVSERIHT